jgi:hypothetical protein
MTVETRIFKGTEAANRYKTVYFTYRIELIYGYSQVVGTIQKREFLVQGNAKTESLTFSS